MFSLVFAMLQCMHLVADSVPVERVWCLLCTRPWSTCDVTTMHMSQILFLSSVFCPVFVLYKTMEYMQGYNDAYVLLQILFPSSMFCLVLLQILFLLSVFCLVFVQDHGVHTMLTTMHASCCRFCFCRVSSVWCLHCTRPWSTFCATMMRKGSSRKRASER